MLPGNRGRRIPGMSNGDFRRKRKRKIPRAKAKTEILDSGNRCNIKREIRNSKSKFSWPGSLEQILLVKFKSLTNKTKIAPTKRAIKRLAHIAKGNIHNI